MMTQSVNYRPDTPTPLVMAMTRGVGDQHLAGIGPKSDSSAGW